ncbi:hypothetical protein [Salinimicrobium gaetbulicola]|uniref:Uncharacterized protein n=1 Tax=Salinimicrobium gaetbulicola TaxID=999702 RepID=A0ABW3ICX9_9FLAO
MNPDYIKLSELAKKLGCKDTGNNIYSVRDWLRDEHQIHVEVGSIWNEKTNFVESYFYNVTAPIYIYYIEPVYFSSSDSHSQVLYLGVWEGLKILNDFRNQQHLKPEDDDLVVAYLKGYADKNKKSSKSPYSSNIETYAYLMGKQGDYIEEGLTDDDIAELVRNYPEEKEQYRLN